MNKSAKGIVTDPTNKLSKNNNIPKKVGMVSLGCDKNRVDTENVLYALTERGYQLTQNVAEARIVMFAPLYLSNYCVNGCVYCPYHLKNKHIPRKKLTQEEVRILCNPSARYFSVIRMLLSFCHL